MPSSTAQQVWPLEDIEVLTWDQIASRTQLLSLPSDLRLTGLIGMGYRCVVFRAQLDGIDVAAKIYRPRVVERNRKRYGISLAAFEYLRNRRLYDHLGIRPYAARPIAYYEPGDVSDASVFVQELIRGRSLHERFQEDGPLDEPFFEMLRLVCKLCNASGISDLDLNSSNIFVRKIAGEELPLLLDFNMVPRHERGNNPLVSLLYLTRLRTPNYRDRERLVTLRREFGRASAAA